MDEKVLLEKAVEAAGHAHCPYSSFPVGAALQAVDGTIFTGCNVENASFGLTVCAERTAIGSAIAAGQQDFSALAIVGGKERPVPPCGACRQVLAEFCGPEFPIILAVATRPAEFETTTLGDLLPHAFGSDSI